MTGITQQLEENWCKQRYLVVWNTNSETWSEVECRVIALTQCTNSPPASLSDSRGKSGEENTMVKDWPSYLVISAYSKSTFISASCVCVYVCVSE